MENELRRHQLLAYASEIGLLEAIAVLLACISIVLVLGGIIAFINIRTSAMARAEKAASEKAEQLAEAAAVRYLEREMPALLNEYVRLVEDSGSDEAANKIAEAQEDRE